ncbi:hypothetical protein QTP88_024758 [Uroleucon formosanum]
MGGGGGGGGGGGSERASRVRARLTAIFGGFRPESAARRVGRGGTRPHGHRTRTHSLGRAKGGGGGRLLLCGGVVAAPSMGVCARVTPLACAAAKTHTGGAPSRHRHHTKIETKVHPRGGGGPSPRRVHSTAAAGTAETNDDANSRRPAPQPPHRQPPAPPSWTYLSACVCVAYSLIIVYTLDAIVFVPASSSMQQRSELHSGGDTWIHAFSPLCCCSLVYSPFETPLVFDECFSCTPQKINTVSISHFNYNGDGLMKN